MKITIAAGYHDKRQLKRDYLESSQILGGLYYHQQRGGGKTTMTKPCEEKTHGDCCQYLAGKKATSIFIRVCGGEKN